MGRTIMVNGDLALKPSESSLIAPEIVEISPEAMKKLMSAEDDFAEKDEDGDQNQAKMEAAMEARLLLEQSYVQKWQEGRRMRKEKPQMGILQ